MQILGFSPRVYAEVRKFFAEHPVIQVKVRRAADFASPAVYLGAGVCERCGWEWKPTKMYVNLMAESLSSLGEELPKGYLPGDFIEAVEWTHAWDQASRSHYCGGRIALVIEPAKLAGVKT